MPHKNAFEPKDARPARPYEDYDDDDDDDVLFGNGTGLRSKKKTATQDLAEFLSTTGPEEFQRPTARHAKESKQEFKLNPFQKLRKNKTFSSTQSLSTPVPPPFPPSLQARHKPVASRSSSMGSSMSSQTTSSVTTAATSILSYPSKSLSETRSRTSPSAPLRLDKHQTPSSYSRTLPSTRRQPSFRGHGQSDLSKQAKVQRAANHLYHPPPPHIHQAGETDELRRKTEGQLATETVIHSRRILGRDTTETSLRHRLERYEVTDRPKPSDSVAVQLSKEHVRALAVSAGQDTDKTIQKKKKVRHVQTQTLPSPDKEQDENKEGAGVVSTESVSTPHTCPTRDPSVPTPQDKPLTVEQLERQLAEEQRERRRLQAALETSYDHFEVLSGAAYRKLRELWEEKQHWEHAYHELAAK